MLNMIIRYQHTLAIITFGVVVIKPATPQQCSEVTLTQKFGTIRFPQDLELTRLNVTECYIWRFSLPNIQSSALIFRLDSFTLSAGSNVIPNRNILQISSGFTRISDGSYVPKTVEIQQSNHLQYLGLCLKYVNSVGCFDANRLREYCSGSTVITQQWPPTITTHTQVLSSFGIGFFTGIQEFSISYILLPCPQAQANCNPSTTMINQVQTTSTQISSTFSARNLSTTMNSFSQLSSEQIKAALELNAECQTGIGSFQVALLIINLLILLILLAFVIIVWNHFRGKKTLATAAPSTNTQVLQNVARNSNSFRNEQPTSHDKKVVRNILYEKRTGNNSTKVVNNVLYEECEARESNI